MTTTHPTEAEQRAAWEDQAERDAVAAQEAGLPAPMVPDFVYREAS